MKKHLSLEIDFHSTVKLTPQETKKLKLWLKWASPVLEQLVNEMVIKPHKNKALSSIRVSLLLCGEARIRKLNSDYRNKDKVTDVLSFPSFPDLRKEVPSHFVVGGELFLGDLAICAPQTKKQAQEFHITFWDEFIHLFFHGLLHLMGYDHEISEKEEKLMQKWEDRALELFSAQKKRGA